jgi:hypothetical protein
MIWGYLDGYTYEDLFGEEDAKRSQSDKVEKKLEKINASITEVKNEISALKEKTHTVSFRDYTHSKGFIESAKRIYEVINLWILSGSLSFHACKFLFTDITLPEKKIWKHGSSPKLSCIDDIFNHMTEFTEGIYNFTKKGELQLNLQNGIDLNLENLITIGNYYLVIAYQIFIIEKLYTLYSRNIKVVYKTKEGNNDIFGNPISYENIQYFSIVNLYEDKHINKFRRCIMELNIVFNAKISNYFKIYGSIFSLKDFCFPSKDYLNGIGRIIVFLNSFLCRFVAPEPEQFSTPFAASNQPKTTIDFLLNNNKTEINYVVKINAQDIADLTEYTLFLDNLQYNEFQKDENNESEKINLPLTEKPDDYDEQNRVIDKDILSS